MADVIETKVVPIVNGDNVAEVMEAVNKVVIAYLIDYHPFGYNTKTKIFWDYNKVLITFERWSSCD
jgi:uncharacterized protein YqgV (UPF0045/DUF77 family)